MSYVSIHSTETHVYASSPFHPELPKAARKIGGDWDGAQWIFDIRDVEKVYAIYQEIYGFTPGATTVDIRVKMKEGEYLSKRHNALYLAGRQLARAAGRDSGATIADGVVVIDGDFKSGGSMKNWATRTTEGAVFEIRDVYALAAENIEKMYGWDDDIESVDIIRTDAPSNRHVIIEQINELNDEQLTAIAEELLSVLNKAE